MSPTGGKFTLWEGGVRNTGIFWAPKMLKPKSLRGLSHITDVLPTLLDAAGIDADHFDAFDGISLWDNLVGLRDDDARTE